MRAAATSRIASSSAPPSTQSKSDANNKADETSPFALLVSSAQAKPAQQKDTQSKDNSSGDTPHDTSGKKSTSQASSTSAAGQTASQASAKPGKADKSDDKNSKDKSDDKTDAPADGTAAAALQQTNAQQQQQSAAQQALAAANPAGTTVANSDASDDEPAVTAAGAAGIAASGQAKAQGPQTARNTQAPGQPASPQAGAQAAGQTAADPTADNQAIGNQVTGKQAAGNQAAAAPAGQANAQASDAQTQAATQNPDLQPLSDAVQQGVPTKPWQAKTQSASDAKTDSSQTAKADDVKQAATPDPQAVAANDMPQTKPVDASGNVASIIGGTTPQTQGAQNNAAPTVTQNVQVSTPTPNMPALAVEIAAKSQSGAKQFDIRLDPPELGRVEVRLSIDATGKASAHLSADQPQTLDLLQKDAPTLTRALRDAGLNVSQNGLNFSLRQQSSDAGAGGNQSRGGGNGRSFTLSATSSIDATSASAAYRAPADGRLDIRV